MARYNLLEGLTEEQINKMSTNELIDYAKNKLDKMIEDKYTKEFEEISKLKGIVSGKNLPYFRRYISDTKEISIDVDENYDSVKLFVNKVNKILKNNKDKIILPTIWIESETDRDGCTTWLNASVDIIIPNKNKLKAYIENEKRSNKLDYLKEYVKDVVINRLKTYRVSSI